MACIESSGKKELFSISSNSIFRPLSRAKIKIFLATSTPDKSIFGSGSVKPLICAVFVTS